MRQLCHTAIFTRSRLPDAQVLWGALRPALKETGIADEQYSFSDGGKLIHVDAVEAQLAGKKLRLFGDRTDVKFFPEGHWYPFLTLTSREGELLDAADELTRSLLTVADIVSAGLHDVDYQVWQSETQVSNYQSFGRSLEGVRLLDDAVWGKVVDVSDNPGRIKPRLGYQESIGHVMWISDRFWELTRGSRDEVAALALRVEPFAEGMEKFVFSEGYFMEADDHQRRIRAALFPYQGDSE